jgi:DNA-binding PucR family transcriptional regulator
VDEHKELERRLYVEAGLGILEQTMIEREVARVKASERSALRAELVQQVFTAKNKRRRRIRNSKGFLAKLLYYDRVSRFRKWMAKEKREVPLVEFKSESDDFLTSCTILSESEDLADKTAFRDACRELHPDQWELLWVLDQVKGNQGLAAKLLRIHRNTVPNRLRVIQAIFIRHGFQI